jgi:hypothetical protein
MLNVKCCMEINHNIPINSVSNILLHVKILKHRNVQNFEVMSDKHNKNLKSSIFWGIIPCSSLKVSGYFRGTHHLHLQGPKHKPNKK